MSRHVAVVGGGLSGLAAAYRLRVLLGPSIRITVLEQSELLGGKVRGVPLAGSSVDVGAEAFLVRRPEAVELITELGMVHELVHPGTRGSTVRAGGDTVGLPSRTIFGIPGEAATVRPVLSATGLARLAAEPELPPLHLDGADRAVGELLRERFGPELGARLVDPLLGGVYAGHADSLGLRATMPTLADALDRGAGSLLAAAQAALPRLRPGNPGPVFGTLRSGLSTLVDRLAHKSAAEIRLGQAVRDLRRAGARWRLEIGAATAPDVLEVDGVVLAVPAPAARRLLATAAPTAAAAYGDIELASTALVSLALPAAVELPEASGVLIATGERHESGTPFTAKAFTYSSRKWPHHEGAHVLVRGSVGRFGEAERLQVEDADLVRAVRADLAELTGVRTEPVDTAVTRWGGALPQYGVGHTDLVRRIERSVAEAPGLAVAGAALRGVGIPACIATGHAAASRVAVHVLDQERRRPEFGWSGAESGAAEHKDTGPAPRADRPVQ